MGVSMFAEKSTTGIGRSDQTVLGESLCENPGACLSIPSAFSIPSDQYEGSESDTLCQKPGPALKFISAVVCVLSLKSAYGLKAVAKGVRNGLKGLGKKIGQRLPGLIGTIVSFIFKTAGQVVRFLGKNGWLLILAVAVFIVERIQKKIELNPLD